MLKDKIYKIKQKFKRAFKNVFLKPDHKTSTNFWIQKMPFRKIDNRLSFFIDICNNKDVLHFGCTDWPIFNPKNNLHIQLANVSKSIDGFDIDIEGIENLKKYVSQDYYSDFDVVPYKKYNVCLIPETIEHVDNVADFLNFISKVDADIFYFTVPNCFSKARIKNYYVKKNEFIEIVHPDHNAWYSPYTLKNLIEKYSTLEVKMVYLIDDGKMVCCEATKKL